MAKAASFVAMSVAINGRPADKAWIRLKLVMENSKHTVGHITMRHYLGRSSRLSGRAFYKKRSRIVIRYGEAPTRGLTGTFRGYITSHKAAGTKKRDSSGSYMEVTYYLIGTSDPMQTKHTWRGSSWSSAAKAIAKRHKMKAVVHTTPKLSKPIVQTTSDFKFLVTGATKTGYRFFVHGTTLYFINPQRMLNTRRSGTPLFTGDSIKEIEVEETENEDPVYVSTGVSEDGAAVIVTNSAGDVEINIGETLLEYGDVPADVSSVSNVNDAEFDSDGDSIIGVAVEEVAPPSVIYDDTVIESMEEAQAAVEARVLSDRLWVTANVRAYGDARVTPAKVVYLSGKDLPPDNKGLWMVGKVTHELDVSKSQQPDTAYFVKMELGRDRARTINLASDTDEISANEAYDDPGSNPWEITEEWVDDVSPVDSESVVIGGLWQAEYYAIDEDVEVDYNQ